MTAFVTSADIAAGLRALGVREGGIMLAHSSLKRFGHVEGGAEAVIDGLLAAVGAAGTVMVPTITGTASHGPDDPPVLDVVNTPCWTGIIPETLRRRPGAIRSLHPTHSVAALGPQADFLTKDHFTCGSPCGSNSPYLRLAELDGVVVFLGTDLNCCTLLHGVEELADCRYHMQTAPSPGTIITTDGRELHGTFRLHQWGTPRRFPVLESRFLEWGIIRIGRVGDAEVRVLRAKPTVERVTELLRQKPRYLVAE
ncbi:MAG: SPBc2 prophage-derived aminoglycoside N(3')-acetyltransferase-like protein YokD [bacterium ADurb.Bin429]|nr:MAG: SPBc2 prophage-derived aminoglycoside N(3')-acetyltransferase-like protein YokD [bacterium ADurb.Bin429]